VIVYGFRYWTAGAEESKGQDAMGRLRNLPGNSQNEGLKGSLSAAICQLNYAIHVLCSLPMLPVLWMYPNPMRLNSTAIVLLILADDLET
jgi:hypothetical protein